MNQQPPKNKILFKPVHQGMGFHPFSDGLPYTPTTKTPLPSKPAAPQTPTTGYGATAAGRPQFAIPKANSLNHNLTMRSHSPTGNISVRIPGTIVTPALISKKDNTLDHLLIRRRAFAYLLDSVVHAGFWVLTNLLALFLFHFQFDMELFTSNGFQFVGFIILSQWIFITLQEMLFETTLGKTFFNLEFKRNHKSLLLRSVVFMMGAAFFGLGFYFRPQDKLGEITLKSKIES